ncbi:protein kinase domain-containing protein [Metabacillus niabensis]|uniref:protein kinase domain-containing protein n=1 Tax=Metabacillus niabensis TaxID=324854 RepID=UPI0009CD53FD|nr:protein kinase [Mycobacteroides abscessus subsp. abscessus]
MENEKKHFLGGKVVEVKSTNKFFKVNIVKQEGTNPEFIAYKTIQSESTISIEKRKMESFTNEANKWFSVKDHPLILSPLYIELLDNLPVIAMPYCEANLSEYMACKEPDVIESLIITAQILKGLIYLQENGVESHQDLKPANILLRDLSKIYSDFPPDKVHSSFRYRAMIADFGLANAYKELGKKRGSLFYMAPEQFDNTSYTSFYPDIFSVGVILTELITGKHPIGYKIKDIYKIYNDKGKREKLVREWVLNPVKKIALPNIPCADKIGNLIDELLKLEPKERPSYEDALSCILNILSEIDSYSSEYLKLLLDFYDSTGNHQSRWKKLGSLSSIVKLPEQEEFVLNSLTTEFKVLREELHTSGDLVYLCYLTFALSSLLLKQKKTAEVEEYALYIINESNKWRDRIKVEDRYPELMFKGSIHIEKPSFSDFEIYAGIIGKAKLLLEQVWKKEDVERYFLSLDNITQSVYYKNIASQYHINGYDESNNRHKLLLLDKCIELNPKEATFYYLKGLWLNQQLQFDRILGILKNDDEENLEGEILNNFKKANELNPNWSAPRDYLSL